MYQRGVQKRKGRFLYITYQRNATADEIDNRAPHVSQYMMSSLDHLDNHEQPGTYITKEILTVERRGTNSAMMF